MEVGNPNRGWTMKRIIAVCLAVLLVSSPLWAETQKQMLYRLQDELNDLKQRFEELIDEMTVKFTQIREMNRQGLDEMNRHLQVISQQLNDQDGRIKAIEPRIEALENVETPVAISDIGDPMPKGVPAPKIGDAVHLDTTTGLVYRADSFVRTNVIGVLGGNGAVIKNGERATNIPGLSPNTIYYLKPGQRDRVFNADTTTGDANIRYDSAAYSQSQGFKIPSNGYPLYVGFFLKKVVGTSLTSKIYIQIRNDDGTGKPGATILATSQTVLASDLSTATPNLCLFYFFNPVTLTANTQYHFCIQTDSEMVSTSNYITCRYTADAYADGQRCYGSSADSWTADGTTDLYFDFYYVDLDDTTGSNLISTHPIDDADLGESLSYLAIYEVGKTTLDGKALDVNAIRKPGYSFLMDNTTAVSVTGTTPSTQMFSSLTISGVTKVGIR